MTLFLNRLPTAVEFSIMEDPYLLNNGSFISLQMVSKAMLSLEEFGIQDYTIDLFKIMIDFLRDEGRVPAKEVLQKKWIRTTLNMDISDEELEKINNAKIDAFSQKNQFDRSQERIEFIGSIKELLKKPKTTN